MGGHITTQNETFRSIIETLGENNNQFFGFEDGFRAFATGNLHVLSRDTFLAGNKKVVTGFYSGSSSEDAYSISDKDGAAIPERIERAIDFIKRSRLDYIVGSGGDGSGRQLNVLANELKNANLECRVLVSNKTMDGDIGGRDGEVIDGFTAPFTDTSNGYICAVSIIANKMLAALPDAWTNNLAVLVTHFGADTNFVAFGAGWYGHADLVFRGELEPSSPGFPIDYVHERIRAVQAENLARYGRGIAIVNFPEGTKIQGINHFSARGAKHGQVDKMYPEILGVLLREELSSRFGLNVHQLPITYDLRTATQPDFPYSLDKDYEIARQSGVEIANTIKKGEGGLETTIKIRDGEVIIGMAPIHLVTRKRFASDTQFPWFDDDKLQVREEFARYYDALFGPRVRREDFLPGKPQVVNVYSPSSQQAAANAP